MQQWVRNAVMMIVVGVWAVVVLTSLWRGVLPDAVTWGVPGGFWFLMNPALPKRGGPATPASVEDGQAP